MLKHFLKFGSLIFASIRFAVYFKFLETINFLLICFQLEIWVIRHLILQFLILQHFWIASLPNYNSHLIWSKYFQNHHNWRSPFCSEYPCLFRRHVQNTLVSSWILHERNVYTSWKMLIDLNELFLEILATFSFGHAMHLRNLLRELSKTLNELRRRQKRSQLLPLVVWHILMLDLMVVEMFSIQGVYEWIQDYVGSRNSHRFHIYVLVFLLRCCFSISSLILRSVQSLPSDPLGFVMLGILLDYSLCCSHFFKLLLFVQTFLTLWDSEISTFFLNQLWIALDARVEITQAKVDDHFWYLLRVCDVKFFVFIIQANSFKSFKNIRRLIVNLLREFLEHSWPKEEPNTMWEVKICLWRQNNNIEKILGIFHISFKEKWADLRDKEF